MKRVSRADEPDLSVRDVLAPELLSELGAIQETIRIADPRSVATEATTRNPKLLSLFRQERRILRELRRRQGLLRQATGWIVPEPDGGERSRRSAPRGAAGSG
jgi:hypothetical protein